MSPGCPVPAATLCPPATSSPPAACVPQLGSVLAPVATAPSGPELLGAPQGPVHGGNAAVLGAGLTAGLAQSLSSWHVTISVPTGTACQQPLAPGTRPWRAQPPRVPLPPAMPSGPRPASTEGSKPHPGVGQEAPHPPPGGHEAGDGGPDPHGGCAAPGGTPRRGCARRSRGSSACLQRHRSIRSMFFRRSLLQESK